MLKTQRSDGLVQDFLAAIPDEARREDCRELDRMMSDISGEPGVLWGTSMVGYGLYSYRYASGREGEWFRIGFAPRGKALSVYLMCGYEHDQGLLDRLGPHRMGKACLYIKRLSDIDRAVLEDLLRSTWQAGGMAQRV